MFSLGVTGGVGTGKSSFSKLLLQGMDADFFSADQCAKELVLTDLDTRSKLTELFGERIFLPNGDLDRSKVREMVFQNSAMRVLLENILHPKIRSLWTELLDNCRSQKRSLVAEIPLLYETAAERYFDAVAVVACSRDQQMTRLTVSRQLTTQAASSIIASQLDLSLKMNKADYVIWNEASLHNLEEHAQLMVGALNSRYE